MSYLKLLLLFAFVLVVALSSGGLDARADYFVWQNQDKDVEMSFPDRWGIVSNLDYDEVIRVAAPVIQGQASHAECRLRVRDDERFKIYPVSNSDEIQREYFGIEFWNNYTTEFEAANINEVRNNAGLGRGFASFADFSFRPNVGPNMIRRGIAFVSLYQGQVHIFECSAEENSYNAWYPTFMGILKSVDFDRTLPAFKQGGYRNFYKGSTIIHGRRSIDDYVF